MIKINRHNGQHQQHIFMVFLSFALLLSFLPFSASCIPLMDEDIGQQIFHENKIYLVYSCQQEDEQVLAYFNKYCQGSNLCAILNKNVEGYEGVRGFIGEIKRQQYFFIIDAERRKKYLLPIIEGMTEIDLSIFYSKFERQELEPFLASEEPDPNPYLPCRMVVGTDLEEYLNEPTPVKVLFLYTKNQACQVCGEMLRLFGDMAEKMYDKEIVSFAYYDVFFNDNPLITDQVLPYFLIFSEGEKQPFGLEGHKMDDLYQTIVQLVMKDTDIDVTKYRKQAMEQIRQSMQKGELKDIDNMEELEQFLKQKQIILEQPQKNEEQIEIPLADL